ncbi:PREDICTED: uncharacterized protein LOC102254262 [Myotis brandtii]|uniref:uncharacterized protein LOC102254262 n=1 Tax=Myotis brandtii TaxID=109478 RepID=UPI000704286B|nr:PREDICTED: uncharacterized protein LOC102254262 [Myotis brandtii]
MKGLGTDENSLIEIICPRTIQEQQEINRVYNEMYKTDMEKDIISDTSGDFHKLIVALTKGRRAEDGTIIDYELIYQDAWDLHDAGVKRKVTDASKWISIMTQEFVCHLQKVFDRYKCYSPYDILQISKMRMFQKHMQSTQHPVNSGYDDPAMMKTILIIYPDSSLKKVVASGAQCGASGEEDSPERKNEEKRKFTRKGRTDQINEDLAPGTAPCTCSCRQLTTPATDNSSPKQNTEDKEWQENKTDDKQSGDDLGDGEEDSPESRENL